MVENLTQLLRGLPLSGPIIGGASDAMAAARVNREIAGAAADAAEKQLAPGSAISKALQDAVVSLPNAQVTMAARTAAGFAAPDEPVR